MNKELRIKMIKAMEYIVRNTNDERCLNPWLLIGIPDGDIEYGDLATDNYDDEYFLGNKNFSELMNQFLKIMKLASYSGGLCCDGVVSK